VRNTNSGVSYQSLGNGTYRVVGAMRRSATSGRFVVKTESPSKSLVQRTEIPSKRPPTTTK